MGTENQTADELLGLSDLGQKERIQILLSEYAAYRAEILARTGYGFQIVTISSAATVWLLQQSWGDWRPWVGLGLLILVVATWLS